MLQNESAQQNQENTSPSEAEVPVHLTAKAAEMVQKAIKEENLKDVALRVGVMGGGCSGLQYLLDFAEKPNEDDWVSEELGVKIYVDPYSATHLTGTTIDYVDSVYGSGFKFDNPNIVRTCHCGGTFES